MEDRKLKLVLLAGVIWVIFGFSMNYFFPELKIKDPIPMLWLMVGIGLIIYTCFNLEEE